MDLLELVVKEPCTDLSPYTFKVMNSAEDIVKLDTGGLSQTEQTELNNSIKTVTVVMPLGGKESGLFRSPKKFEKVLVGVEGEETYHYYLMGYLPTYTPNPVSQDFQTKDILADNGEVFRYKQTGKTAAGEGAEHYSEIGFYQKPTKWKPDKSADYAAVSDGYPKIDRINIHSTGDIHESAVNHHHVEAARLELLAGADAKTDADSFKQGDMRIKANKDITIEAGGTLTLKAGRTTLIISDSGFSVTHRIMSADIPNTFDAGFSLNSRNGISMSGQTVGINSRYKWSIADGLGAGVSGTAGVLNLSGRQISAGTANKVAQISSNIAYGFDFASSIATAGAALREAKFPDEKKKAEDFAFWFAKVDALAKLAVDLGFTFFKLRKKYTNAYYLQKETRVNKLLQDAIDANEAYHAIRQDATQADKDAAQTKFYDAVDAHRVELTKIDDATAENPYSYDLSQIAALALLEPYEALASLLDILLTTTGTIYSQIEYFRPDVKKDDLNFAALIVDNTIIETVTSIMLKGFSGAGVGAASLCLGHDGSVVMKAAANKALYADTKTDSASALSLYPKWAIAAGIAGAIVGKVPGVVNTIEAMVKGPDSPKKEETL
ncbi:MAG: hypothetical protein LBQ38_02450 [Spirochaetaceae bacterium]|jgi:hypothetical protein|nr:hypothetical protein [Spirochaetaceae bacterium]